MQGGLILASYLHGYQEEVGKDFKRITLYLCTAKEFYRSETIGLDWNDATDNKDKNSADILENSAPAKRLKEDPHLSCDKKYNERRASEETEMQIQHDEEVAMELQRQFLDEIVCPNQVATPTADQNVEAKGSEKSTSPDKEDETDFTGKENFTTPCCGPGSRKESGQGKPVLYPYKTENIITAHFKLVVL